MEQTGAITRAGHKIIFALKKHSPEICIVAGIAGTIVSTILACRATLKVQDVLEEHKEKVDEIREEANMSNVGGELDEDEKRELTSTYTHTTVKLIGLYAPAAITSALSISCLIGSHYILRKRNLALAAAYVAVDRGFKEYRSRVVDRYGEDVDKELKYNLVPRTVEEEEIDEKTGKKKKVKRELYGINLAGVSEYAVIFGPYIDQDIGFLPNARWNSNMEYNFMFLKASERYMNDILHTRGYLFLNEVYRYLGVPETQAGQIVGWRYKPHTKNSEGDNYVDFGPYEQNIFLDEDNDNQKVILLDFNVDGNIWDEMRQ